MFMGEFSHTIDAKGRLIIPAKLRDELGEHCIVTKGIENCLTVYTLEGWEKLAQSLETLAPTKSNVRAIKRYFFGSATELEFDKQGRVLIPAVLRNYANLNKDTVVVGASDRVEIWGRTEWETYNDTLAPDMEALAEALEGPIAF